MNNLNQFLEKSVENIEVDQSSRATSILSYQCITNGSQCANAQSCLEYTIKSDCETNPSISGSLKCNFENDYNCSEAETSQQPIQNVVHGFQGVTKGKDRSGYQGYDRTCVGLKGTDGNCEGDAQGTIVELRSAPMPITGNKGDIEVIPDLQNVEQESVLALQLRIKVIIFVILINLDVQPQQKAVLQLLEPALPIKEPSHTTLVILTDGFCKGVNTTEQPCQSC